MPSAASALLRLGQSLSKTASDLRRQEQRIDDAGARGLVESAARDLDRVCAALNAGAAG